MRSPGGSIADPMKTALRFALVTLATLLLVEAGLRVHGYATGRTPPHPDPSVAAEWKWAQRHLEVGEPTLPGIAYFDPDLGWAGPVRFRRARGGPKKLRERRHPGVPRLLLVGDSFTRDLGRMTPEFQPDWEVLNFAVQAFGVGQVWLRHRKLAPRYPADVVVFGFYLRDYFRMLRSFRSYAKPTFGLDANGEVVVEDIPVIAPEDLFEAYRSGERRIGRPGRSVLFDFVAQRREMRRRRSEIRAEEFRVFAAMLRSFADEVRSSGACPLLMIFPTRPNKYEGTIYQALDERTRREAERIGLPHLALADGLFAGNPAEVAKVFNPESGSHMSEHGRHESIRLLHEALQAAEPGRCPNPSGAITP